MGALGNMGDILQSIRTNVLTAANGSQSQESLNAIQAEIDGAVNALDDIVQSTSYNGQTLLDGNFSSRQFAVGENSTLSISIPAVGSSVLGSSETGSLASIDVTSPEGAQAALETIDQSLDQISQARSSVGSSQNEFASSINTLSTARINLESAQSQIMDMDLAEESMVLSQMKTLEKASLFALAQTNKVQKAGLVNLLG